MDVISPPEVTRLLLAWRQGEQTALEKLIPLVEAELRRIAHHYMMREREGHTLQTTALMNEAYLRLVESQHVDWQSRAHFLAISAQLMRRVLVSHARSRKSQKRGAGELNVTFDEENYGSSGPNLDLVALDDALQALMETDPRKCRVVEMHYFGGLSAEEIAEVLNVSQDTVFRDLRLARVWLRREIMRGGQHEG